MSADSYSADHSIMNFWSLRVVAARLYFALSVVLIASIVLQNLLECLASLALSKVQAIKASGQISVANLHLK